MTYDCMTPDELTLWRSESYQSVAWPCVDCPLWFEMQAREAGVCSRKSTPERRAQMVDRHRRKGAK